MNKKLDEITSKFIHSEGKVQEPSLKSYVQSLEELLNKMEAKTMTEARRLEIMKEQVKGIRRQSRRLEEKLSLMENENKTLREQIQLFEQEKNQDNQIEQG